jgi:antitoxin HigA-1
MIHNPHAGEILKEEFLEPLHLSQNALAKAINVSPNRIHAIIRGARKITADTDLRLCKFFKLNAGYFLRLQVDYEILKANKYMKSELCGIKAYKIPTKATLRAIHGLAHGHGKKFSDFHELICNAGDKKA